jgi:superfamily II DNA helicase RecQ
MALYAGKDVVACAPTGAGSAGKTLSFWIPLLMAIEDGLVDKMTIVVTPLNLLGKQNVSSLAHAGISAIAIDRTNASVNAFKVHQIHYLYVNS